MRAEVRTWGARVGERGPFLLGEVIPFLVVPLPLFKPPFISTAGLSSLLRDAHGLGSSRQREI